MKYILLLLFTMSLTGCVASTVSDIDYEKLIDDEYGTIEDVNIDYVFEGLSSDADFISVLRFEVFEDMINCDSCGFVEGKVISIRENNMFTNNVFVEISTNEFDDQREIIRISILKNEKQLVIGGNYILNLSYVSGADYYFLSQGQDSVFRIFNEIIVIPERYIDANIPTILDEFLSFILID